MSEQVLNYVLNAYHDHIPLSMEASVNESHRMFELYVESFMRNNSRLFDFAEFFNATG